MKHHTLKLDPHHFNAIACGAKSFELRKDDRDFNTGDTAILSEYDRTSQLYSGRYIIISIGLVYTGLEGIDVGYGLFSITVLHVCHTP